MERLPCREVAIRVRYCCAGIVGEAAAISEVEGEGVEPTYITLQCTLKIIPQISW